MFQKIKRIKSKSNQKLYYDLHVYDEYLLTKGIYKLRDHVHEIEHGSNKTYENWNMIALTKENHSRAHGIGDKISQRDLFFSKLCSGSILPVEILIKYNLMEN